MLLQLFDYVEQFRGWFGAVDLVLKQVESVDCFGHHAHALEFPGDVVAKLVLRLDEGHRVDGRASRTGERIISGHRPDAHYADPHISRHRGAIVEHSLELNTTGIFLSWISWLLLVSTSVENTIT